MRPEDELVRPLRGQSRGESRVEAGPAPPVAALRGEDLRPRVLRARLYAAALLVDAVGYAYPVCVAAHAQDALGASPTEIGWLGAVAPVTYSAACFAIGGWSDRKGSMRLIQSGLLLLGLAVLPGLLLRPSFGFLVLLGILFGISLALFWPPLLRELALLSPGRILWRSLGAFNIAWAIGACAGSRGGPGAYQAFGLGGAALIGMGIIILAILAAAFRSPPSPRPVEPIPIESLQSMESMERIDAGTAKRFLLLGWSSNFLAALAGGGLQSLMVYVGSRLSLGLSEVGWILLAKEAGRLIAFMTLRQWSGWHYSLGWLAALQIAGGGALLLCGLSSSLGAYVILFGIFGLFTGASYYSSVYYSLNLRAAEGRKSALHEGILSAGVALGPLLCGRAGDLFPAWPGAVPFLPGALIAGGLVIEIAWVLGRTPRREGLPSGEP